MHCGKDSIFTHICHYISLFKFIEKIIFNYLTCITICLIFRDYWLNCFEESIENYVKYAIASQPTSDTAFERAAMFKEKFISRVQLLKIKPL